MLFCKQLIVRDMQKISVPTTVVFVNHWLSRLYKNKGVKNTLKIIRDNPGITVPQIAARLDKNDATIERHIRILRQRDYKTSKGL